MDTTVTEDKCSMHKNVLIVEDSKLMAGLLSRAASSELGLQSHICPNYEETRKHLADSHLAYFAALLDLNLPDAPNGEIVDLVLSKNIPTIVFTAEISDSLRDTMWAKHIVDYVIKDNIGSVNQLMAILKRLSISEKTNILIADDSTTSRNTIRELLSVWKFNILEAKDGREALDLIQTHGDINLLITDYNMPHMDGIELVKEVRRTYSKSRLPIIGVSGAGGASTSAYFIKSGANDYIHKPFLTEELYCRVISNIETAEYIATIRDMAEHDYLTKIYNRRTFFRYCNEAFTNAKRGQASLVLAMLDIDHFKQCNDTYGHDVGDDVIRFLADTLNTRFQKPHFVARFGGEEFCVACVNLASDMIETVFDKLRHSIEKSVIQAKNYDIRITISIGVCACPQNSLDDMLKMADNKLYEAKENGRNQVLVAR